jgi:hypothetical protein
VGASIPPRFESSHAVIEPSALRATKDPKKSIELGANDKKGRYVRIQLLDDYYLSLAEVQVVLLFKK